MYQKGLEYEDVGDYQYQLGTFISMFKYEIFHRAFLNCDNYYCQNIKHFPMRGKTKTQTKMQTKKLADIEGVLHNLKLRKIQMIFFLSIGDGTSDHLIFSCNKSYKHMHSTSCLVTVFHPARLRKTALSS